MNSNKTGWFILNLLICIIIAPHMLHAASVRLSWQPNTESDLQEYNVYSGTQPRTYGPPMPVGNVNDYEIADLQEGGIYYFCVTAIDNAGNESGFSTEVSKQIPVAEDVPPEIAITSPVTADTYTTGNATISLSGNASDDNGLQQISWTSSSGSNGIANGTTNWAIDAIDLVAGENHITVMATDTAGNNAQDTLTVTCSVVNGLPIINVASSSDDGNVATNSFDNDLSTRWSANGDGQWIQYDLGSAYTLSHVLIAFYRGDQRSADFEIFASHDATNWNRILGATSSGATLQQEHYSVSQEDVRYIRIVGHGNTSNAWNSITEIDIHGTGYVAPDATAPTIGISSPVDNDNYQTTEPTVRLAGNASDENGVVDISWMNSNGHSGIASGTTSWTTADIPLQEGTNTITVTAKDAAGNEGSDTLTVTYSVPDVNPPVVDITSPVETNSYTTGESTVTVAGTAGDDHDLQQVAWSCSTGGNGIANGTDNWSTGPIDLVEGSNIVTITATDRSGNEGTTSIAITRAVSASPVPVAHISTSADDGNAGSNTIDNNLATRWSANGNGQWIQYDLGTTHSVNEIRIAFYRGDQRSADFEVLTSNNASNWNQILRTTSSGASLQLEPYSIPDTAARYVRIVGYGNSVNTWNSITEVDIFGIGNISSDVTSPSISISSPTSDGNYESSESMLQLAGTASDDSGVIEVSWRDAIGNGGIASGTTDWTIADIPLQAGTNAITVTAKDAAGNEGSNLIEVSYAPQEAMISIADVVTSSDDGNVGINTIDDDLSTRWSATGDGQWVQYDLGAVYDLRQLNIAFFKGDSRTAEFEVLVSSDAQSWNSVLRDVSGGNTLEQETYHLSGVDGRFVRIVGYGNSVNSWNSITEVDISGIRN